MERVVSIEDFREISGPILDVRSPDEFARGHIPIATNFELFSDDERAEIGICFKENGQEAAVQVGLDLIGPKLGDMVRRVKTIAPNKAVRIHCWRGGMRSQSMAWLLETVGMQVSVLEGGYKNYRHWVRETIVSPRSINIVGGLTGTGKTQILECLQQTGEQIIDLEGLANHRGSSFGGLGMPLQPTTQHLENLIAEKLSTFDSAKSVWIEAESIRIGSCSIPEGLFHLMKSAPVFEISRPIEARLDILTEIYGSFSHVSLIEATKRISQRLGGLRAKIVIEQITDNKIREACELLLDYYDRSYTLDRKYSSPSITRVEIGHLSAAEATRLLIEKAHNMQQVSQVAK
jgi:tRNA 2-selenouridine synthase